MGMCGSAVESCAVPLFRGVFLFWSLCYLAFRCVLQLVLRPRPEDFKELEIVVL